ncbi:MAG: DUF5685 family protein [Waltera sp.]
MRISSRTSKKGTYNPLKKRYEEPGFEEECRQILTMMMSECCKEFEQLPYFTECGYSAEYSVFRCMVPL